jgi:hypothetical protein
MKHHLDVGAHPSPIRSPKSKGGDGCEELSSPFSTMQEAAPLRNPEAALDEPNSRETGSWEDALRGPS